MNDHMLEPGWWQASDGRWYRPEDFPGAPDGPPSQFGQRPAAPAGALGVVIEPAASTGSAAKAPAASSRSGGGLRTAMVAVAALLILVAIGGASWLALSGDDQLDQAVAEAAAGATGTGAIAPPPGQAAEPAERPAAPAPADANAEDDEAGPGEEEPPDELDSLAPGEILGEPEAVADVGGCRILGTDRIEVALENRSQERVSYVLDVVMRDSAGTKIGADDVFVRFVRPKETVAEMIYTFEINGAVTCEIGRVRRWEDPSLNELTDATCRIVGVDSLNEIEVRVSVTNPTDDVVEYDVAVAIMRDGKRIGIARAGFREVYGSETDSKSAASRVQGPDAGATCEIVDIERTTG